MYDPSHEAPTWTPPAQQAAPQPPNAPDRMPAGEARRRAGILKRWVFAGTSLAFCALTGLAASHLTGVTSAAAGGAGASSTATPSGQNTNGGFFPRDGQGTNDSGGQNSGQNSGQNGGGGYQFGSGGSFQPPAASSGGS